MNPFIDLNELSIGGLSSFEFIPLSHIESFPAVANLKVTESAILLFSGRQWLKGISQEDALEYDESSEQSSNGLFYNKSLNGFLPYDKPEIGRHFHNLNFLPVAIKCVDRNGLRRIFGYQNQPAYFAPSAFKTETRGKTRGYKYSFKAVHTKPSFYLI